MWIESTIAMRFLREGRAQTALIVVGIAVGVAVIVFITALIQGLQSNIIERTLGTQSHIKVEAPDEVNLRAPVAANTTQLVLETRRAQRLRSINNWQQVMATRSHAVAMPWNRWHWWAWIRCATSASFRSATTSLPAACAWARAMP
jgi:ABC-type lipoprotein release transport system permease subunit